MIQEKRFLSRLDTLESNNLTEKFTLPLRGALGGRHFTHLTHDRYQEKKIFNTFKKTVSLIILFSIGILYTITASIIIACSRKHHLQLKISTPETLTNNIIQNSKLENSQRRDLENQILKPIEPGEALQQEPNGDDPVITPSLNATDNYYSPLDNHPIYGDFNNAVIDFCIGNYSRKSLLEHINTQLKLDHEETDFDVEGNTFEEYLIHLTTKKNFPSKEQANASCSYPKKLLELSDSYTVEDYNKKLGSLSALIYLAILVIEKDSKLENYSAYQEFYELTPVYSKFSFEAGKVNKMFETWKAIIPKLSSFLSSKFNNFNLAIQASACVRGILSAIQKSYPTLDQASDTTTETITRINELLEITKVARDFLTNPCEEEWNQCIAYNNAKIRLEQLSTQQF